MLFIINIIKEWVKYFRYKKEIINHVNQSIYKNTLYSVDWLKQNHDNIMNCLPENWTHIDNFDYILFGINLKILNVHWNNKQDLIDILEFLENMNFICRKNGGFHIIRNLDNSINQSIAD